MYGKQIVFCSVGYAASRVVVVAVTAAKRRPAGRVVAAKPRRAKAKASDGDGERRTVRSKDRVRDLGEVFTPRWVVDDMLDLIPAPMWLPHPSATFLEPACGDGNFLVAVLERKLAQITDEYRDGKLPAGTETEAALFHAVEEVA